MSIYLTTSDPNYFAASLLNLDLFKSAKFGLEGVLFLFPVRTHFSFLFEFATRYRSDPRGKNMVKDMAQAKLHPFDPFKSLVLLRLDSNAQFGAVCESWEVCGAHSHDGIIALLNAVLHSLQPEVPR